MKTITGLIAVLLLALVAVAFAAPQQQAAQVKAAWSAPTVAIAAGPATQATPKKAEPQSMKSEKMVALFTDVGVVTGTTLQALLAITRPAGETTLTTQAYIPDKWITVAYTFTRTDGISAADTTKTLVAWTPASRAGQYIGDTVAFTYTPVLTAAGTLC